MKYKILTQISTFLDKNTTKITSISRTSDLCISINFAPKLALIFDMSKNDSAIYADTLMQNKEYKAPFDVLLKKRFNNSKILSVKTLPNDRILVFETSQMGSYKEIKSRLYFEFTGRFTNVIITDFDDIVLGALHLYKDTKRDIQISKPLSPLESRQINEKESQIIANFDEFFKTEQERIKSKNLNSLKQNKIASVEKKISNLQSLINALPSKDELSKKASELSKKANILKAHLYEIKDYERDFCFENLEFHIEKPAKIAVDEMFKTSKKLKAKAANIIKEEQNLSEKKEFLLGLKEAILAENNEANLEALSPKKSAKIKNKNSDFCEDFYKGLYKISVGKNERGNAWLLENAKKDDVWFHLQGYKGAHVVIKSNKQKLSDDIIAFASRICVLFSGHKSGSFAVDFTKRSNVKVVKGAFVNYVNYNTVGVKI